MEFDARFVHGSTHLLVGPSGSGKTFRTSSILANKNEMIEDGDQIKNVVFFYATWQKIYEELDKRKLVTKWVNKVPTNDDFVEAVESYKHDGGSIVVIDDFMSEIDRELVKIVTVSSRHLNTSTFILFQSLFPANPLARQISLNVKYMHIHKNPRENAQIQYLARQLHPGNYKWIVEAYHEATKLPYTCFLIDLIQTSPEQIRFRSDFLPDERPMRVWMKKTI